MDCQCVYATTQFIGEQLIDHPMARQQSDALEGLCYQYDFEMRLRTRRNIVPVTLIDDLQMEYSRHARSQPALYGLL